MAPSGTFVAGTLAIILASAVNVVPASATSSQTLEQPSPHSIKPFQYPEKRYSPLHRPKENPLSSLKEWNKLFPNFKPYPEYYCPIPDPKIPMV